MPWVDPDALMVPECWDIKCDKCGRIEDATPRSGKPIGMEVQDFWENHVFYRRPKPDIILKPTFCRSCAELLTPYVYRLRDIDELTMYVNKLRKAINEKRNQDNRATANTPCQRGEGSP